MKFKSNISYLAKKISTLPRQMAQQCAVEVDVKKKCCKQQQQYKLVILLGLCHCQIMVVVVVGSTWRL